MGTNINLQTSNGNNCLHIAAVYGHLNLCRTLIRKHNFDVQLPDHRGWTGLHYFAKTGSYELVQAVADMEIDINLKANYGENCLHIAADCGHFNLCRMLISKHNFDVQLPDHERWTALHYFSKNGSYELVKLVADMGADINLKTIEGKNCLHIAADCGHFNLCRMLISEHKFDVNLPDHDGWTALHYFAKRGSYELVKVVVDMGADINLKTFEEENCLHIAAYQSHFNLCKTLISKHNFDVHLPGYRGWTALHYFAENGSYELIKVVAGMDVDINLKTKYGMNCLHIAADCGRFNLCRTLISKHNVDVQLPNHDGWTALHYFAKNGSYDLVKFAVDMGADINLKTINGENCLHIAAGNSHLNLCRELISKYNVDVQLPDHRGWTAFHYFAKKGSYELVKFVADIGIDINLKTNNGKNCLHIAAGCGHFNLCRMLISKHHFDVQLPDHRGWTALHYFAKNGRYELAKVVADMGADINLKTFEGKNSLHIAADWGRSNLCKTLISKHYFDVQLPDHDGWTALHYFAENGSYELVKSAGIDINLKTIRGENCLHIAAQFSQFNLCKTLISKHNFDVQLPNPDGWTALHFFAKNGSYELIKVVADMGADINLKTNEGKNCLHIAADWGHFNLCKTLISKHKFDVKLPDHDGWTALHYFAKNGSYELVKLAVDKGADINLKTTEGKNCLHIAADWDNFNLCKTLISEHNFDVQLLDHNEWTAFHYFAKSGSCELVKLVADMGADINLKTIEGKNCLHIAADWRHFYLCKTLITKHNFDVQLPDHDGWTALHYFVKNGSYELVEALADMKVDINLITNNGMNCLHIATQFEHMNLCKLFIEKYKFDINIAARDGRTPLHFSTVTDNFALFSYFLGKGSEIFCKTCRMENVLHLASFWGSFNICEFVLEYFIKHYEDNNIKNQYTLNGKSYSSQVFYKYKTLFLHAMDVDGNTYLHLAAKNNKAKVCELLLRYDTEIITSLNKEDKTARDIAKDKGCTNVLNVLKAEYERSGTFFKLNVNKAF